MKTKPLIAATVLLATIITIGSSATEIDKQAQLSFSMLSPDLKTEVPALHGLKVAIIRGTVGSSDIITGDYQSGLNKLTHSNTDTTSGYDKSMGLCVANIKLNELESAHQACTDAIEEVDTIIGRSRQKHFLKALAYSNRAIVHYLSKDNHGALKDFTNALFVDDNDIVKANIAALSTISSTIETSDKDLYSE